MKRLVLFFICLLFWFSGSSKHLFGAHNGVPEIRIEHYKLSVEVWWAEHPFNPQGDNYDPDIISPEPVIDISDYGNDIQAAIDALPNGGTILFHDQVYTGDWEIVGRGNIHFLGSGNTVISSHGFLAGCEQAKVYEDFVPCLRGRDRDCMDCFLNTPCRNIYFKDILFDGQDVMETFMTLRSVADVIWDNCTFQNLNAQHIVFHGGSMNGNSGLTNLWLRNCHLVGDCPYAVNFDGLFNGGLIECTIENGFNRGGPLMMTNDDITFDIDEDGIIEYNERRQSNFNVIYGCTIHSNRPFPGGSFVGRHCLVKDNTLTMNNPWAFTNFDMKTSLTQPYLVYDYYGNVVTGNNLKSVPYIARFNETPYIKPGWNNRSVQGRYTIKGNAADSVDSIAQEFEGIVGPNAICGNCIGNLNCVSDACCDSSCVEDAQPPTVPLNFHAWLISDGEIVLRWDSSEDNTGHVTYHVLKDGLEIGATEFNHFRDPNVISNTRYEYTVLAEDYFGNNSSIAGPISVRSRMTPVPLNLIRNGSFEEIIKTNGQPDFWQDRSNVEVDSSDSQDGNSCLKITSADGPSYIPQGVLLEGGRSYVLTGWIRTEGLTGRGAFLRYVQTSPNTQIWGTPWSGTTNEWLEYTTVFATPSDYGVGRIDLVWEPDTGEIRFDHILLSPLIPTDVHPDGVADYKDMLLFGAHWLESNGLIDLFGDGQTDGNDYTALAEHWLRKAQYPHIHTID